MNRSKRISVKKKGITGTKCKQKHNIEEPLRHITNSLRGIYISKHLHHRTRKSINKCLYNATQEFGKTITNQAKIQ